MRHNGIRALLTRPISDGAIVTLSVSNRAGFILRFLQVNIQVILEDAATTDAATNIAAACKLAVPIPAIVAVRTRVAIGKEVASSICWNDTTPFGTEVVTATGFADRSATPEPLIAALTIEDTADIGVAVKSAVPDPTIDELTTLEAATTGALDKGAIPEAAIPAATTLVTTATDTEVSGAIPDPEIAEFATLDATGTAEALSINPTLELTTDEATAIGADVKETMPDPVTTAGTTEETITGT